MDVPEMQAMGHIGYRDVALDREGVTRAFTSAGVKEVIERRGIRLLSYAEAAREAGAATRQRQLLALAASPLRIRSS
jgi:hypothetical protein